LLSRLQGLLFSAKVNHLNRWTIFAPDRTRRVWNRNESSPCESVMHDAAQPKRLVQKRIILVWFHSSVSTLQLCLVQKWIISLNALFYTNTPLKRPKQETIRMYVINCMPCCNFTVNIGFLAAHEDRNTVKLQSRFSLICLWLRWTTFVPIGSYNNVKHYGIIHIHMC